MTDPNPKRPVLEPNGDLNNNNRSVLAEAIHEFSDARTNDSNERSNNENNNYFQLDEWQSPPGSWSHCCLSFVVALIATVAMVLVFSLAWVGFGIFIVLMILCVCFGALCSNHSEYNFGTFRNHVNAETGQRTVDGWTYQVTTHQGQTTTVQKTMHVVAPGRDPMAVAVGGAPMNRSTDPSSSLLVEDRSTSTSKQLEP